MNQAILYIENKTVQINIASNWDELTPEQFQKIVPVVFSKMDIQTAYAHLVRIIIPLKEKVWAKISLEDVMDALPSVGFLLDSMVIRTPKVPSFRFRLRKYYGPEANFANLSELEFGLADTHLTSYLNGHNDEDLNRLIAILYKPKNEKFENTPVIARAKKFQKLPNQLKLSIFYNFLGMQAELPNRYPYIYNTKGRAKKGKGGHIDWRALTDRFAKYNVVDVERVKQSKITDVWSVWNTQECDRQEEERNSKKK